MKGLNTRRPKTTVNNFKKLITKQINLSCIEGVFNMYEQIKIV